MNRIFLALLLVIAGTAQAATVTYNFTIIGDVTLGDDCLGPNSFNLTGDGFCTGAGDTITATGAFTADLGTIGNETGTVSFGVAGNSMSIDMNGAGTLTDADDTGGSGPSLSFLNGDLTDFDFLSDDGDSLSSLFLDFTNGVGGGTGQYVGEWRSNVTLTVVPSPVPVPAAAWLFGSSLGVIGWIRRRPMR